MNPLEFQLQTNHWSSDATVCSMVNMPYTLKLYISKLAIEIFNIKMENLA